jgi:hypothetical protein
MSNLIISIYLGGGGREVYEACWGGGVEASYKSLETSALYIGLVALVG